MPARVWSLCIALLFGVTGWLLGLQAAHANPWKYGKPHRCPAGSPPASCSYPPDLHDQRITYALNGMLLGLLTAVVLIVLVRWIRRRTRRAANQSSPLPVRV
jgi:hypothetical protein